MSERRQKQEHMAEKQHRKFLLFPSRHLLDLLLSVQQYHFCCCCHLVASVSICLLLRGESNTRPSPGRPECASCLEVSPVIILNKNVLFRVIWVQLVGAAWPLPLTRGHQDTVFPSQLGDVNSPVCPGTEHSLFP